MAPRPACARSCGWASPSLGDPRKALDFAPHLTENFTGTVSTPSVVDEHTMPRKSQLRRSRSKLEKGTHHPSPVSRNRQPATRRHSAPEAGHVAHAAASIDARPTTFRRSMSHGGGGGGGGDEPSRRVKPRADGERTGGGGDAAERLGSQHVDQVAGDAEKAVDVATAQYRATAESSMESMRPKERLAKIQEKRDLFETKKRELKELQGVDPKAAGELAKEVSSLYREIKVDIDLLEAGAGGHKSVAYKPRERDVAPWEKPRANEEENRAKAQMANLGRPKDGAAFRGRRGKRKKAKAKPDPEPQTADVSVAAPKEVVPGKAKQPKELFWEGADRAGVKLDAKENVVMFADQIDDFRTFDDPTLTRAGWCQGMADTWLAARATPDAREAAVAAHQDGVDDAFWSQHRTPAAAEKYRFLMARQFLTLDDQVKAIANARPADIEGAPGEDPTASPEPSEAWTRSLLAKKQQNQKAEISRLEKEIASRGGTPEESPVDPEVVGLNAELRDVVERKARTDEEMESLSASTALDDATKQAAKKNYRNLSENRLKKADLEPQGARQEFDTRIDAPAKLKQLKV